MRQQLLSLLLTGEVMIFWGNKKSENFEDVPEALAKGCILQANYEKFVHVC